MSEKIEVIYVETRRPRGDDLGQVEEGFYKVKGDIVYLVTAKGAQRHDRKGRPIKQSIGPGETARKVAWRLTKDHMPNRRSGFNRPLQYFNHGKI